MRRFTRAIGIITSAVMLISSTAFAIDVTSSISSADVLTLTFDCGTANNGKKVSIQIYEPGTNGLEDLKNGSSYDVTDEAKLNQTLSYVGESTVSGGTVTVSYTPKGKKGDYTAYIKVRGQSGEQLEFTYERDDLSEPAEIISNLIASPTANNVKAIFAKEADAVITGYEFLDVDTDNETKDIYEDFDALLSDTQKDIAYAAIANRAAAEITNPATFRSVFKETAYLTMVDNLTGDNLLSIIDEYKDYSGIGAEDEYTKIRAIADRFGVTIKTKTLEAIAAADMSTYTAKAQPNAVIKNALLMSALSYCEAPGTLAAVAGDFSTLISTTTGTTTGTYGDIAKLTGENKLSYAAELLKVQPFADLGAFVDALNTVELPPVVEDTSSSSTGSSGGSAGIITRPSNNQNIFTDNGTQGSTPAGTSFTDLKGYEWAESAITTLKNRGIINGKSDTEYAPADIVLREEFAKMIMLTVLPAKIGIFGTNSGFGDIDPTAWHAPFITAASKSNIITGYGDMFGLGDSIRREDMVVMCYRAVKAANLTLTAERADHKFTDTISDYAKEAVSEMYKAGLVKGYSETEFDANGTATRAEAATMLYNIIQKYGSRL